MAISRARVPRFARRFSRSAGLQVLTSLDDFASRSLASLDGYRDGSQVIMKQPRLAESFMAISRAPVPRFAQRFFRFPRPPKLTSLDDLASRFLASLGDYHDATIIKMDGRPRIAATSGDLHYSTKSITRNMF